MVDYETKEAKAWGINFGDPKVDLDKVRKWKNQIIDKMASGLTQLSKQRNIKFISGIIILVVGGYFLSN